MILDNIRDSQKVIVVLDSTYKTKAENLTGGVGDEYRTIKEEIKTKHNKYILITFEAFNKNILPIELQAHEVVSITSEENFELVIAKLLDKNLFAFSPVAEKQIEIQPREIKDFIIQGQNVNTNK